jgi:hypothetical protein
LLYSLLQCEISGLVCSFCISPLTFPAVCRKLRNGFRPHGVPSAHGDFFMRGCFEEQGVRVLNRLGPRRESRMDRIGTMASLQHGSTIIIIIIIIIVMVDRVDGRCGRRNRWTVMASVTRAYQRKIHRIPKSISSIFVFIERETSSSSTTASHRQQQEP